MVLVLSGVIIILVGIVGYFAYVNSRKKTPDQNGLVCDRTEDKGFYQSIDPLSLPCYQEALYPIFTFLDASHFKGTIIPAPMRDDVERMLSDAAVNPLVNPGYLRVMLCQFLQSDIAVRQQDDVLAHWAQRVYELDREGSRGGPRWVPSAWKVYFMNSMNMEAEPNAAGRQYVK